MREKLSVTIEIPKRVFKKIGKKEVSEYTIEDLKTIPGLMIFTSLIWFLIAGIMGISMPLEQIFGLGTRAYYSSLTSHGAAIIFPGLFQFMIGLTLIRTGGCMGKPVRGKLPIFLYIFLNLGSLIYATAILLGARWSHVLMFPLPLVGASNGLWSSKILTLGFTGILLVLISVILLYPIYIIKMMFFEDSNKNLIIESKDFTDPGMLGMVFSVFLFTVPGLPILITAIFIGTHLFGVSSIGQISFFTEPIVFQYFFWIWGHNLMEAMGVMSIAAVYSIVPLYTLKENKLYSRRLANLALIITTVAAATAFFHHLYTTTPAQPAGLSYHAQIASWATGLGGALTIFTVLATIWIYGLKPKPAVLGVLVGFFIYVIDGSSAMIMSIIPWNYKLHGTLFIGGHAMTVLTAILIIWFGVFYHYYPILVGKPLSDRLGNIHIILSGSSALGLFYTFAIAGVDGLPRRMYPWPEHFFGYEFSILVFGLIFAIAQIIFLKNIWKSSF